MPNFGSRTMNELWAEELGEEEIDRLVERLASEIARRGMEAPAVFFLEMQKPIANVSGHAAIAFSPFLIPFFGFDAVNDYSRLLRDRRCVDRLIDRIVAMQAEGKEKSA